MKPENNSRMTNVLGVAMLLDTYNTPALTRSSESFCLSTNKMSEDNRRFNMTASY